MDNPRNLQECETPRTDALSNEFNAECSRRFENDMQFANLMRTQVDRTLSIARQLERELRQARGRWIPVSERLPDETKPHEGYVLVSAEGAMDCMAFYKGQWQNWTNPESPNVHPEYITHWMPLPTPPASGEKGDSDG